MNTILTALSHTPTWVYLLFAYLLWVGFKASKTRIIIQVPGSWMTLTLIFIIFASKYYFSYKIEVDPALSKQIWFEAGMLVVSGACTGLFIGRLLSYLCIYSKSNHVSLLETDRA